VEPLFQTSFQECLCCPAGCPPSRHKKASTKSVNTILAYLLVTHNKAYRTIQAVIQDQYLCFLLLHCLLFCFFSSFSCFLWYSPSFRLLSLSGLRSGTDSVTPSFPRYYSLNGLSPTAREEQQCQIAGNDYSQARRRFLNGEMVLGRR